jgi:hypothetical protein
MVGPASCTHGMAPEEVDRWWQKAIPALERDEVTVCCCCSGPAPLWEHTNARGVYCRRCRAMATEVAA